MHIRFDSAFGAVPARPSVANENADVSKAASQPLSLVRGASRALCFMPIILAERIVSRLTRFARVSIASPLTRRHRSPRGR